MQPKEIFHENPSITEVLEDMH